MTERFQNIKPINQPSENREKLNLSTFPNFSQPGWKNTYKIKLNLNF